MEISMCVSASVHVHLLASPAVLLSVAGLRMSLSSMLTIWLNLGLSARSLIQHSSMS